MPPDSAGKKFGVHPDVLKLGLVSFLTDLSSEMIFSVFAIFFTTIAGASAALLGLIEGLADLSASSLNYLAGWLSDRTGKRKVFALAGYGFSTLAKIILLVSSSVIGPERLSCHRAAGQEFPRAAARCLAFGSGRQGHQGVLVRRAQGAGQVRRRARPAGGVRPALVAWRWSLDVPDPVLGRARSRRAQHRGLESHQGSAGRSAPAREHVRHMENPQPGIQALPCHGRHLFAGLFQLRLSAVACAQRRFCRQGHRAALRLVQYRVRRCGTADRQTRRPSWAGRA